MVNISKIIHSLKGEVSQEEIKKDIKAASIIIRNTSLYVTLTAKVKKSKLIVRDMKNNQVMNETNIDKEGNACINITDSGVLEAPKIAFYIRIGEEEIRLKPDRKLSANLKGFSHVLELEDVLIVPYTTIKGNLSVKVIKRHYYGESDELPYGVSRVLVDNHKAELGGWLFSDNQTKSNSQITMKKRASNLSYRLPTIFDGNYWSAEVNLNDIHPSKGIWDFYLEVNNDKNYRILIENNLIENLDSQVFNVKRESRWHTFYKTKNDGLSSTVKSAAVQILDVKAEIVSKYKVKCSGTMDGAFINNDHDLEKAELFIAKRNNGKSHFEPIKLHPKEDDHYEFTFDLDYQEVISNRENEKHRWDVYLQIPFLDIKRRYRFRLNIKEIAYQSRVEFEGEKLNQIYFYPTVNEQLSIVQKDLSVERNIDTLNLANGHLNLSGYAYLDTVEWIEKEEVTRNLIIRERETEEDYKVPLKGKYNNLEKFGYRYHYSGFEVEVNLNEFISSTTRMKKVFDLYVEFKYKNIVKERRIGREEFDYFKDDVLAREVISREDGCEIAYITYTPSGNIKIETNHIPTEAMEYLSTEIRTPPEEEIWLIGERPNTAQDTGYHFFKFCRENYPDMKVYYAIESDSEDLLNIEHLGNVVHIGSIDHYKVASQATALIGSHDLEYFLPAKGIEFNSYKHGKRIFLQHGVLGRKNVEYHKQYYKYPFHVFCVSSQPEKN
ncbi:hypothetical protein [Halobacillus andaensis]|uniref:hypothetical protein n=1 Tax=Halobacillus andaensis TaxID=1176239 RepID=UPI003D71A828